MQPRRQLPVARGTTRWQWTPGGMLMITYGLVSPNRLCSEMKDYGGDSRFGLQCALLRCNRSRKTHSNRAGDRTLCVWLHRRARLSIDVIAFLRISSI